MKGNTLFMNTTRKYFVGTALMTFGIIGLAVSSCGDGDGKATSTKGILANLRGIDSSTQAAALSATQVEALKLLYRFNQHEYYVDSAHPYADIVKSPSADLSRSCPRGGTTSIENSSVTGDQKRVSVNKIEITSKGSISIKADNCQLTQEPYSDPIPETQKYSLNGTSTVKAENFSSVESVGDTVNFEVGTKADGKISLTVGVPNESGEVVSHVVSSESFQAGMIHTDEIRNELQEIALSLFPEEKLQRRIELYERHLKCAGDLTIDGASYACESVMKRMIAEILSEGQ